MYSKHFNKKTFSRSNYQRPRFNKRTVGLNSVDIASFIRTSELKNRQPTIEAPHHQNFSDFKLHQNILQAVEKRGYTAPTQIQSQVIPLIIDGKDVVGLANTGTGKTGAFLIPLIQKTLSNHGQKVLILAPTRELALQIEQELLTLGRSLGIRSALAIGGTNMSRQYQSLHQSYHFLIGTPGRITDLSKQKRLPFEMFKTVVLDEVDRMLDMGFIHDVRYLLNHFNSNDRQSLFFSATITPVIRQLISQFSRELVHISVKNQESAAGISQQVVRIEKGEEKITKLQTLLSQDGFQKVLIFGRTKHGVNKLAKRLLGNGFRCDSIHGNKSQNQRQQVLSKFRNNRINILVATDVAARGIDVADITHVINFDPPATYEDYIHRIGRTGRGSQLGTALTFVD